MTVAALDRSALHITVKSVYSAVAADPHGEFHFETGCAMAERLGYEPADVDRVPREAIDSFAGVGHVFDLADLQPGERVVDNTSYWFLSDCARTATARWGAKSVSILAREPL